MTEPKCFVRNDGTKEWLVNGKLHREDGPAIEWPDGAKEWWVDGNCHRLDGPAVERADGTKEWRIDDMLHRLDGPALEYSDGRKYWWVDGKCVLEQDFSKAVIMFLFDCDEKSAFVLTDVLQCMLLNMCVMIK